jgi:hypothetical protein
MLCYVAQFRRAASGKKSALLLVCLLLHKMLLNLVGLPQAQIEEEAE